MWAAGILQLSINKRTFMKKVCRMLVFGMLAGLVFGGMLRAEDGDRSGSVRGT